MNDFLPSESSNQLLASLPAEVLRAVESRMQSVELEAGAMLYEAGTIQRYVYFPVTAVVSLVSPMQNGTGTEVAVVGPEGVVGVCAFMGGGSALSSAVVQHAGRAWRMSARDIAELARDVEPMMQKLLRYTQALFTHMAQMSACHTHHSLAAQLSCWLLQHVDRQVSDEVRVTHEGIAGMLGVRREGVTGAAIELQREGLIRYSRGRIQVLDKLGLERHSCECYGVVDRAYAHLRQSVPASPRTPGAAARAPSNGASTSHAPAAEAMAA